MNRFASMALSLGVVVLAAAAVAVPGLASAEGPTLPAQAQGKAKGLDGTERQRPQQAQDRERPTAVAVAFGAIEADEEAYIDFHAAMGSERQSGALRFWTEDDGFYNGAVRTVTINGQNVHAEGAGPLWKTDGTRVPVRFTIDLNGGSNHVKITVVGRNLEYTIEGTVEGFVFVGAPPQN